MGRNTCTWAHVPQPFTLTMIIMLLCITHENRAYAFLQLHNSLLVPPDPVPENYTDERWKRFKTCLGALDWTYIRLHVPEVSKPRFRTRKGEIATNVLGACSRDMLFTFVFPGWEGSASDSRVLRDALSRPTGLKVPTGMDARGCSQINEQERRGNRRVWVKEEEEALLGIMDEIVANGGHADCDSFKAGTLKNIELRQKDREINRFPLYERLANIFGKDHATGKMTYTPETLAADLEEDDNFGNEFEMPAGNFSPMSVNHTDSNQTDSNQQMNQASSQLVSRKRFRSKDPTVSQHG
ncbi:hypothetical protein Dsin_008986 [Dipteronia sinensis]|uniref:DDE Tnp4 domain-containing protein n=1 Tax=Dipteronia sinensis TaxID=43782 RepID=A0AAE0EBB6_9ROSI|nr:hypothetical protein Dsin_008986 [Dipteronia sinensis]